MIKRLVAVFLVLILSVATLAGCAAKVDPSDPNQGLWKATSAEMLGVSMEASEMFGKGFTIELRDKGKCSLNVDGKKANGTWTLDGSAFTVKGGGLDCEGTLSGGKIVLNDVMGMGMALTFEKEGGYTGSTTGSGLASDAIGGGTPATGESLPEGLAWWDGSWYGWINVLEGHGAFSGLESEDGDCYAFIDMNSDGSGTLYMWDDYVEMGTLEIFVDLNEGDGPMGELKPVSGTLFSQEVSDGDFYCDPADEDYDNLFYIYDDVRTSNDDYARYEIYLRPWGTVWDDMPSSMQPMYYSDWYIGRHYIDYEIMLEALENTGIDDEYVYIHEGLPARAYAADGGATGNSGATGESSQGDSPAPTPAPSGGGAAVSADNPLGLDLESGETQEITTIRATKEKLRQTRDELCDGQDFYGLLHKYSYQDFADFIGCDASEYMFYSGSRYYTWYAEGDNNAKFYLKFTEESSGWAINGGVSMNLD